MPSLHLLDRGRRRLSSAFLAIMTLGAAAFGCQVVAGITGLTIDEGAGGSGGATSTTTDATSTSAGGGGNGGEGGGPECTSPSECGVDTDCRTFLCESGACNAMDAAAQTPCDDGGGVLCNGRGDCAPASCSDGVMNGSETGLDCGGPDLCPTCDDGQGCGQNADCTSGYCDQNAAGGPVCTATVGDGTVCAIDDECTSVHCVEGVCCNVASCDDPECESCAALGMEGSCQPTPNLPCGTMASTGECDLGDTCDSSGVCQPNPLGAGTSCGDPTDAECDLADTCDGAGQCQDNLSAANVFCGGGCTGETLTSASTCDGQGSCQAVDTSCAPYACNTLATACNTTCAAPTDCASTGYCANPPMGAPHCNPCGTKPPNAACNVGGVCETCSGMNACTKTCDVPGECSANITLTATLGPATLVCGDQCNNITVTCQGPFDCSVDCGMNGCTGLTLNCDPEGPCMIMCGGMSCGGTVKQNCGNNMCTAGCAPGIPLMQTCNNSCGCTSNCL